MERDSPKITVFCDISRRRVFRLIFFRGGQCYWRGAPGHVGKLVNTTTRGWGDTRVHLPRLGPTTLA
jgi:hypothetical protein